MGKLFGFLPMPSFQPITLDFTKSRYFERAVRKSFQEMDVDKSGTLDIKELYVAILKLYDTLNSTLPTHVRIPSLADMRNLMNKYDKDGKGSLTFPEFLLVCRSLVGAKGGFFNSLFFKGMTTVAIKVLLIPLATYAIKEGLRSAGSSGVQLAKVPNAVFMFGLETAARMSLPLPIVLDAELQGSAVVGPNFPDAVSALFVTCRLLRNIQHSSGEWRLRGCIGTLEPRQLRPALRDYALISALRDSRFAPVTRRELSQLCCKVSLLSCFEVAADWQDWVVGTHGIIIEFSDPESGCRRSATFLPDVPPEQGWSVRDTLDALLRKAGFRGQVSASLLARIKLTRYQSSIASLTHEEYVRVRGEVQQLEGCWAARTGQEQEQQVAA
ncbi:hypothetical protein QJQ45_018432 [Haematococcus lacustris]|nr:hypothetical protein QJQ45_018432 [Haematococcus lacustris]